MKKLASSIIGGIAGAVALNILHQTVRQFRHDAPRVDLIGEEGLTIAMKKASLEPLKGNALFAATMAADLLSNAAYYTMIGLGKKKYLLYHGAAHGLCAGIGAADPHQTHGPQRRARHPDRRHQSHDRRLVHHRRHRRRSHYESLTNLKIDKPLCNPFILK
jgi:hypothetical protein